MSKIFINQSRALIMLCLCLFCSVFAFGQGDVTGTVEDSQTGEPLIGISVSVKGKVIGTITDIKGKFKINTNTPVPFTLVITSVGYQSQEVDVTKVPSDFDIKLVEQSILGQEIVVSASRVAESEMKSPVTVEKIDLRTIRETASNNFYDAMANMKGINLTTQGFLFKSVNMRGFGSTGNPRVVQMIDGMDNMSPALNFAVDNIVGMPELDVENVEILPGAASALYGPNAINGLILMNSKSPFLYQGLSANVRGGIMSASNRSEKTTPFYDASIRYAKAFNDKVAFKVNLSYLRADDWEATNYDNLNIGGDQNGERGIGVNPNYDGTNVYGDEVAQNMQSVATSMISAGLLPAAAINAVPDQLVSRTGFREVDMIDSKTESFKTNLALHFRPTEKMELIGQYNFGYGTTLYTGTGRYALKDFNISQAKLELKADNFNIRAYTTQENSGKSATLGLSAVSILNATKPHATWFGQYVGAYVQSIMGGMTEEQAHFNARGVADKDAIPTGDELKSLTQEYNEKPIVNGGGGFEDKSNLYHIEGNYNFKNEIKFMELLLGANYRVYNLKSGGTLFNDQAEGRNGKISIGEYGAYMQAGKSMWNDHFKLIASLRYDKNENFDGQWSPRVSGIFSFGQNNIRLSYQTGFRIPTTQNQYINLETPGNRFLIGGLPEFNSLYSLEKGIPVHIFTQFRATEGLEYFDDATKAQIVTKAGTYANTAVTAQQSVIVAGVTAAVQAQVTAGVTAAVDAQIAAGKLDAALREAAITAGVTAQMQSDAVQATIAQNVEVTKAAKIEEVTAQVLPAYAIAALPRYEQKKLRPERITSYEIGYKGLIAKRLFVDAYYYFSEYKNFLGGTAIVVPDQTPRADGLPVDANFGSGNFRAFSRPSNTSEKITVQGWAAALNYSFNKGYNAGVNIAYNELDGFTPSPEQLYAGFNTPKYTYNFSFGKRLGSGDRFGFNINLRHQDKFLWEASFVQPTDGSVPFFTNTYVPAITNVDAQVSMKVPSIKSIVKVGGTNIGGDPYFQAYGSAMVGSTYYVSLTFDQLFNK